MFVTAFTCFFEWINCFLVRTKRGKSSETASALSDFTHLKNEKKLKIISERI